MVYQLELEVLNEKLEGIEDFMQKMEVMDEIFNLKVKHGLIQRSNLNGPIECVGCGS